MKYVATMLALQFAKLQAAGSGYDRLGLPAHSNKTVFSVQPSGDDICYELKDIVDG
jgi:hypothetical protein